MRRNRFDHNDVTKPARLQRIEVITGVERRRRWSAEERLRIVAESLAEGAVVSHVARRHGVSPQQLFGWRAQARSEIAAMKEPNAPMFAPAILAQRECTPAEVAASRSKPEDAFPSIEITLGAATVRIRGAVDAKALMAVLKALKVTL
jgi:transposase